MPYVAEVYIEVIVGSQKDADPIEDNIPPILLFSSVADVCPQWDAYPPDRLQSYCLRGQRYTMCIVLPRRYTISEFGHHGSGPQ